MSKYLRSLENLETWFQRQKRVLPWRNEPTLYRVWVSEIMLQQTQVVTVIPYFEKFIQRFPTLKSLAEAKEEDVMLHWAGLGYYSRARNLHRGAKKIIEQNCLPENKDAWLEIPGVGPYTAGAIVSIALNHPEPILDGNVERVLSRIRRVSRQMGDTRYKQRLWKLSRIFVTTAERNGIPPSHLNQSLMELGALICVPRNPRCEKCPLTLICRAFQKNETENYPPRKKPKKWIRVEESLHCVVSKKGNVLLRKRKKGEWREGLWDLLDRPLPGVKSDYFGVVETKHVVTRHKIERKTQIWKASEGAILKKLDDSAQEYRWVSMENPDIAVGSALRRTLGKVKEQLDSGTRLGSTSLPPDF